MKNVIIIILGLLITAGLLVACGPQTTDPDFGDETQSNDDNTDDPASDSADSELTTEETIEENLNDISGLSDDIEEAESLDSLDEDLSILNEI